MGISGSINGDYGWNHSIGCRAIGSGNAHEAAQVTRASLGLCLLISFVTVILLWIGADAMIGLFGLDEASRELSVTIPNSCWIYSVFAISMVLGTAQRAAGDAKLLSILVY